MRRMGVFCGLLGVAAGTAAVIGLVTSGALASTAGAPHRTARAARQPSSALAAPVLARFGNPDGHAYVPSAGRAVSTAHPNHVIGHGTPASCTSQAVVKAVAEGGVITFNCGSKPVVITMTATAKVVNTSHQVVLDGGGKVTLSGGGKIRILYMNTCDPKQKWTTTDCWEQEWPRLVVQNMTFTDGYSAVRETSTSYYGGGAIFDEGGQLKVVNSAFIDNGCYKYGPDLGGAAIRALGMWTGSPVYVTGDTFRGGRCSNGGALSSIDASWDVLNSVMTDNKAIGWGANPSAPGTPGGGSGGAIYNDGDSYNLLVSGSVISDNGAREGGGGIFYVADNNVGKLTIKHSTLHHNPSGEFWTPGYPGIFFKSSGHPIVIDSKIN
jgi:hypothetical protein